jgi:hypothetical protein
VLAGLGERRFFAESVFSASMAATAVVR